MANFKFDRNTVYISGDISIKESSSLYNFLTGLPVSSNDRVEINLSGTEVWDSSTIQIFLSFMKNSKKKIVWKNIPEEMKRDIKLTGLLNLFKGDEK